MQIVIFQILSFLFAVHFAFYSPFFHMNKYCDMGNGMYVYRMQHYPPKKSRFIGSMSGLTVYSSLGIRKHQTFSIFFIFRHGRKVTKKNFHAFFHTNLSLNFHFFDWSTFSLDAILKHKTFGHWEKRWNGKEKLLSLFLGYIWGKTATREKRKIK